MKRLKMKDLERRTGVGREAIRFYIHAGLLPEPERPARNVAWYDESFVERIALIKRLQQERYLPLAVIKAILNQDRVPPAEEVATLRDLDRTLAVAPRTSRDRPAERVSRLAARLGVSSADVLALGDSGVVEVVVRDGDRWVEGLSVAIAEAWARLRRSGFGDELGFGPAQTGMYAQFVRWLAREELTIFAHAVAGKVDREKMRAMAEVGIEAVNEMIALLRERVILRYIAEGNVPEAAAVPPASASAR